MSYGKQLTLLNVFQLGPAPQGSPVYQHEVNGGLTVGMKVKVRVKSDPKDKRLMPIEGSYVIAKINGPFVDIIDNNHSVVFEHMHWERCYVSTERVVSSRGRQWHDMYTGHETNEEYPSPEE